MKKIIILSMTVMLMLGAGILLSAEETSDGAMDVTVWEEGDDIESWSDPIDNVTEESEEYGGTGAGNEPDADAIIAGGGDGTGRFD